MEELVVVETALLAKEKGFDENCENWFSNDNWSEEITPCRNSDFQTEWFKENYQDFLCMQPTQNQLQKWLRDEYKLRVFVKQGVSGNFNFEIYKWNYDNQIGKWKRIGNISSLATYEEALEKGLFNALNLIEL